MFIKKRSLKLSLLLTIVVILSLVAQASVNRDLTQADSPDPETTIDPILDYVEDVNAISGSATDTAGQISMVQIQINRSDDGNFWNGSAWQPGDTTWINTSPIDGEFNSSTESWTIKKSSPIPLPTTWVQGSTYYIKAKAFNGSAYDLTPANELFTIGDIGWDIMETGIGDDFFGIWGNSSSAIFASGGDPELKSYLIEQYNGSAWNTSDSGSGYVLRGIWGSNDSDIFAVGSAGTIVHYNGSGWSTMNSTSSANLYDVWGSSSTDVFAVGDDPNSGDGLILHYDGSTWGTMHSNPYSFLQDIGGTSSDDVYVLGYNNMYQGIILHYNGSGWNINSSANQMLWGIWGTNSSDIFVVGQDENGGVILHYNGTSWSSNMLSDTQKSLRTVWGTSSYNVFAGGDEGTILYFTGTRWIPSYSGTANQINAFWGNEFDVYAAGSRGTILRYNAYPDKSVYLNNPQSVTMGNNFSVVVGISKTTNLYSGQFSIEYDPDIIRVVSPNVSDGVLYGDENYNVLTGGNWSLSGSGPDGQGIINVNFSLSNYADPVGTTVGTLAELHFNANSSGSTNISFIPVLNLSDNSSTEIPAISWYNSSITIKKSRPPAIDTLSCSAINHSTIQLTWNATGSGVSGSEYDIRFRSNVSITDDNWDYSTTSRCDGEPPPKAAPLGESFDVSWLNHNTRYYFAVKVTEPESYPSNLSTPECVCNTPPWYHDLDISSSPDDGGSASSDGTSPPYIYIHDSVHAINATPNGSCWEFVNWTSNNSSYIADVNASSTTITILGNYSITANFAIKTSLLNTSSTTGGNVTTPGGTGPFPYDCGTVQNIEATNDSCYHFVNWTGTGVDAGKVNDKNASSTDITMDADYSVQANFAIDTFTLDMSNDGHGTTTPVTGGHTYNCSENVTITATNDSCYTFVNWSGTGADSVSNVSNASTTIFMNGSKSIQANFMLIQYNLNVSSGGNGSATPPGITSQNCNYSIPIVATADLCYTFLNWSGTGADSVFNVSNASTTIFMNGSKNIQANFIVKPPWDVNCDGKVSIGDMVRIGQHWGQTGTPGWIPEDVNKNGIINIGDMVIVGQHWTG